MVIKHWQGYGSVTAKKVLREVSPNGQVELVIKVSGNHECGLVREYDNYTIYNWLVKKFDRSVSEKVIRSMNYSVHLDPLKTVDGAIYRIHYQI